MIPVVVTSLVFSVCEIFLVAERIPILAKRPEKDPQFGKVPNRKPEKSPNTYLSKMRTDRHKGANRHILRPITPVSGERATMHKYTTVEEPIEKISESLI